MTTQDVFCPNSDCLARGQTNQGNIRVHSQKEQRYRCTVCQRTFAASKGTPVYRLHIERQIYLWALTLLAFGCPPIAIVRAFMLDERTVRRWHQDAGTHCMQVQHTLVETQRAHGQIQADELHIKTHGGVVWVACAMAVASRLWLGGVTRYERDHTLAVEILALVRRCVQPDTFWLCVDGWSPYVTAAREVFRSKLPRFGRLGRCEWQTWPGLVVAQVVKQSAHYHLVGIIRRLAIGEWSLAHRWFLRTQGHGVFSTAWIERLNATFRQRLHAWRRRGRARLHSASAIQATTYFVGTIYNFCTPHCTLSREHPTTPAMATGITTEVWSIERLLTFHPAIEPWEPPKHRGRKSSSELVCLARWRPDYLLPSEQHLVRLHG
jgi:transposase-like protein